MDEGANSRKRRLMAIRIGDKDMNTIDG